MGFEEMLPPLSESGLEMCPKAKSPERTDKPNQNKDNSDETDQILQAKPAKPENGVIHLIGSGPENVGHDV